MASTIRTSRLRYSLASVFIISTVILAALLLGWIAESRYQDFLATHRAIAEHSTRASREEIERYIDRLRHRAELFVRDRFGLLALAAQRLLEEAQIADLRSAVRDYFPESLNFAVADASGQTQFVLHESMLDEDCRHDLQLAALEQRSNRIFIHSALQPESLHFDILSPIEQAGVFHGIFLVSLSTTILANKLDHGTSPGHALLLLRERMRDGALLIDVATQDGPLESGSATLSSDAAAERTLASEPVQHTQWRLIDLHDPELLSEQRTSLWRQASLMWLAYAIIALALLIWLRREARRRGMIEVELRETHNQLEARVAERTRELEQSRAELSYQATHDALTGLVNRREFERRLDNALGVAHSKNAASAVFYIDLDQFKVVNDTAGHIAGDELLRQVSELLRSRLRALDTVARLGGDEFGVLLNHCPLASAQEIAEGLRAALNEFRFTWHSREYSVGASIGVVPVDNRSFSLTHVLSMADAACYTAKDQGRNRVHVYQPGDVELERRTGEMHWASRIRSALESDDFVLFAQPIVAVNNRCLADAPYAWHEVLTRLREPNGRLIDPDLFIVAAERYGRIQEIDRWVVANAVRWLQARREEGCLRRLNINLSGQSLADASARKDISREIDRADLEPGQICFEITETAAIANLSDVRRFVTRLRERGVRFALDDFGTGLSSFAYLKNLNVDYLKVDGSLIRDMQEDRVDYAMVESIVRIAGVMGNEVIAEWVEDASHLPMLADLGVQYVQGYAVARPAELDSFLIGESQQAGEHR